MDHVRRNLKMLMRQVLREPIAVLALVAAIASAVFARQQVQIALPSITFERLTSFGGPVAFSDPRSETGFVSAERLHVLNAGGRTATLTALVGTDVPAFSEAFLEDGRPKLRRTDSYTIEVALLKDDVPRDLDKMLEVAKSLPYERLELPFVVNEPIESGKARVIGLIFRLRGKDGKLVTEAPVSFSCKARFSDGSVFDVYAGFSGGP